jgi:sialate O-acetylesterase
MNKRQIIFFALILIATALQAQVRLANVFGDDMVLQQKSQTPVWGWASPGEEITIKGSWDNAEAKTKADFTGQWKTTVTTPTAGGPYTIVVKSGKEIILNNIMIGEVWICSGQSNMQWSMSATTDGATEIPNANYPNIRLFQVDRSSSEFPQIRGEGRWQVCSPETVKTFSAVGYFFSKKLNTDLNIPIGIMNISWGGTPAEAWTPQALIDNNPELKAASDKLPEVPWGPVKPGRIYNSMIHPIVPFPIAGAIWYQGESNVSTASTYKQLMETMIQSWRTAFNKQFPFYYVQIAPYNYGKVNHGTWLRDQQTKTLSFPGTGMVVVSDLVDNVNDIHPKFKKTVGERLANWALGDAYGRPDIAFKMPLYNSMKVDKGKITILFDNCPNGLMSQGGEPTEFMIAGENKQFVAAKAKIVGSTVILSSKEVKNPVAVRFGWANTSMPNLFSKEGLPVSCFRTDDWME